MKLDISILKQQKRRECCAVRASLETQQHEQINKGILKNILSMPEYIESLTILSYVSIKDEAGTLDLLTHSINAGKQVAVPLCDRSLPVMDFFYIQSVAELVKGCYGLLEPASDSGRKYSGGGRTICFLPGLCFDRNGGRLGYGKGYYDRYLQNFTGITAGLCFSGLLSDTPLPQGPFDRPVDILVTEKGVLRVKNRI